MPRFDPTKKSQFDYFRKNIPTEGDILKSLDKDGATVHTSEKDGKTTRFVNACIDPEVTGWYLSCDDKGLKCLIVQKDHDLAGEKVKKLRVLRQSDTGRYLICEVIVEA